MLNFDDAFEMYTEEDLLNDGLNMDDDFNFAEEIEEDEDLRNDARDDYTGLVEEDLWD